ncbi:MAG: hypothetical protein LBT05_14045, partial [Planctomycetaceae bacterium]|nr:hypothetical protein [Planctomycetaceae bacterium]
ADNIYRPVSPLEKYKKELAAELEKHPCRNVAEAISVIKEVTDIDYKRTFAYEFLTRLGFRPRKVGKIPAKQLTPKQSAKQDRKKRVR